jgi:glycosyltransferase involved in cell wall biosynthesis
MSVFHPLVSIVIPVYNGENFLSSAVDSALVQTYDNCEVIVVNDGSVDGTEKIALSYGEKIRYFRKENGGVSTALNMAIENASGEYISWCSHDDYYLPEKIEVQINALGAMGDHDRKKIIPFSDFSVESLFQGHTFSRSLFKSGLFKNMPQCDVLTFKDSLKVLFGGIHGCTLLMPKQAFVDCGLFRKEEEKTQDYSKWIDFISAGYRFFYVPEILIVTRYHEKQGSRTGIDAYNNERDLLRNRMREIFKADIDRFSRDDIHFRALFLLWDKKVRPLSNMLHNHNSV